jgi:hypothetical protein
MTIEADTLVQLTEALQERGMVLVSEVAFIARRIGRIIIGFAWSSK